MFESFLCKTLSDCNISHEGLITDNRHNTTLAFETLNEAGERDFSIYRNFGADIFKIILVSNGENGAIASIPNQERN